MRYHHRYWWQVLILVLWAAALCVFAYWIEGFEPKQYGQAEVPEPQPDELTAEPEEVGLRYLAKDIYIDGIHLNNYELEHPLYIREGSDGRLYFALDDTWRTCLGFEIDIIRTEHTILIHDADSKDPSVLKTGRLTCNLVGSSAETREGFRIVKTNDIPAEAGKSDEDRRKEEQEAARVSLWLDTFPWLEKLPYGLAEKLGYSRTSIDREVIRTDASFLQKEDGLVYLPFDWFTEHSEFGWSVWTDDISGVYISTDPEIDAERYYSANNASYINGLARFMCSLNRRLSFEESVYYVYLFRHEGWVSGVDPIFLMAVARNESTFRSDVVGGGAIGLMQIMPKTGARFGYSVSMLYDPHMNIQFGASYIARFLRTYGSPTVALSAYNAGPGRVASGDYSTAYAEHVLGHQQTILGWMRSHGYSTVFDDGPLVPAEETTESSGE